MTALNDRQLELQKENENLTKLRDELLPLLINGQVSVRAVNYDLSAFSSSSVQNLLSVAGLALAV